MKNSYSYDDSKFYSLPNIPRKIDPLSDDFDTFVPQLVPSSFILKRKPSQDYKVAVNIQNLIYSKWSKNKLTQILNSVNMTVPVGIIYSLLGPSGCGKTTLLRTMTGSISPSSGTICVFGFKPGSSVNNIPGTGIGYMPQEISLYYDLTIEEMITYFGRVYFINDNILQQRINNLLNVMDLPKGTHLISNLSEGQKRRVSFACSLVHKPKLLVLDEPTVGVDPILRQRIWRILENLAKQEQITIIITTHYIEETKSSNLVGFMRKGEILIEDSPSALIRKYEVPSLEEVFYQLCIVQKKQAKDIKRKSIDMIAENYKYTQIENILTDQLIPKSGQSPIEWMIKLNAITRRIIIQTFRTPSTVFAQFILPILSLILFCLCVGQTPKHISLGVINEEWPPLLSQQYLAKLSHSPQIQIINCSSLSQALNAVARLEMFGVIHIHSNFSNNFIRRVTVFNENLDNKSIEKSTIKFYADLTNKVISLSLLRTLNEALQEFIPQVLQEAGFKPNILTAPVAVEHAIYGEYKKDDYFAVRDYGIPSTLVILTYTVTFGLTILTLLGEKNGQILERNYVAGIKGTQIIFGHLIARTLFMSFNAVSLLLIALYLFEVANRGPLFYSLVLLLLQSLTGLTHGMLISSICPQILSAAILSNGVLLSIFIISGVLWPFESLPLWVRPISYIQPTTLAAESIRSILSRGLTITHHSVLSGFVVSAIWTVIFLVASIFYFNRITHS